MKKKASITSANLKILLVIALVIPLEVTFPSDAAGQKPTTNQITDESGIAPYYAVDEMPMYPGGDAALMKYIGKNIHYPLSAQEKGIQGKVIIKFCVTAQGGISLVSVLKGIDPEIDKEAIRVIKTIKTFNPGKKDGVAVPVWYLVPITFSFKTLN